jgi:hypothetical protein
MPTAQRFRIKVCYPFDRKTARAQQQAVATRDLRGADEAIMKRREFITLLGGATALPLAARAQQATKMARIGVLTPGHSDNADPSSRAFNAFLPALRELGYTEGQNIAIERKFGEGDADRLRRLAAELVEHRVDAIVANSTPAARAAKQATSTIPIVAIAMADPVDDELVASLARPGGNVTGTTFLGPELVAPTVVQGDRPRIFSRGCSLAPPCIWRAYHGRHVEGDRERGPILRDKTSICAGD